jgi:hypothetical protein
MTSGFLQLESTIKTKTFQQNSTMYIEYQLQKYREIEKKIE